MLARIWTNTDRDQAQAALENTDWNLDEAVSLFYAAAEEAPDHDADADFDDELNEPSVPSTTPAQPSGSSSQRQATSDRIMTGARPPQRPKQMTLEDLKKMQGGDDDDDDEDKKPDMFAGGEKSGLAVQNPDKNNAGGPANHFQNILNRARQNQDRPPAAGDDPASSSAEPPRSSNFTGRAQTLGGDDAESQIVSGPTTTQPANAPRVNRTLHLWADGVSIDDGPLFRFDDPANADMMAQINQGRAPLSLLDVQPDQEVDLNLSPHKDENYKAPAKKWRAFEGQGNRLGAPTPSLPSSNTPAASSSTSTAPAAAPAPSSEQPQMEVDDSQPTLQLQVRLGDGTRLSSRFNTTHTIGDVYEFVERAQSSGGRAWVLMTTFPSKELTDKGQVLGEMGDFKRGGVVVQKWR